MNPTPGDLIREIPAFRRLSDEDRLGLAAVSRVASYLRGDRIFREGDPSDAVYTLVTGRVKVFMLTPGGRDVILEIFGPGDFLGTVAVYEDRPFPASAVCLHPTTCLVIPKSKFFSLLESRPSLVRGLLSALTRRVAELAGRIAERTGGKVETRLARLFLRLVEDLGQHQVRGTLVPLALTRSDLAALTGTTVETSIRIMSRWGKEGIVLTVSGGFLMVDRAALENLAGCPR